MTRLILIRHGETDWNLEGRWQGQADTPLNERGREQARQLACDLSGVDIQAIYSSDLQRAMETAQPLALAAELQIHTDVRLREINQGEWQGLRLNEIQARYAELYQQREQDPLDIAPPGGESILQMQQRAFKVLDEILQQHAGETVAIVCHGLTIAVIRVRLEGCLIEEVWSLIPKNGGWVEYGV